VHEGHRKRMKKRFLKEGLDGFEQHNLLELLLFFAIPQKDTNPLAHALMDRFGNLAGVMDAQYDQLLEVKGVGENAAVLIKLIPQLCRSYLISKRDGEICLCSTEQAGAYLMPHFFGSIREKVLMICLDAKCKVLNLVTLCEGSANSARIDVRHVVEQALHAKATSIILAHNHTSGIALPSEEDETTTRAIAAALKSVGIGFSDHIIIADGDFVSMAQNGTL